VRVWNRHFQRAHELCDALGGRAVRDAQPADLVLNCTPVGLDGTVDAFGQLPFRADELAMFGCVIDFVYGGDEAPLVQAARAAGLPTVDGLDLLIGQGALSFERFTGLPAPVEQMRAAARAP
jgi:shikimate dehydrogenase